MRACSDTLRVRLYSGGRWWSEDRQPRARLTEPGRSESLPMPAAIPVEWEATVYQHGSGELMVQGRQAAVEVRWLGDHSGQWRTHRETLWIGCGEDSELTVHLPREVQVQITTDPAGASVFVPTGYASQEFVGTTPLTRTLLADPGQRGRWRFVLQKSGMRADTLEVESPREGQVYRVVLHPLADRSAPQR